MDGSNFRIMTCGITYTPGKANVMADAFEPHRLTAVNLKCSYNNHFLYEELPKAEHRDSSSGLSEYPGH